MDKKQEKLGMPYGTAFNRLRKQILFALLLKYRDNVCIKCGLPIETPEELSIEHIVPWQTKETDDLFWDLNNIAFSHLKCNISNNGGGFYKRKIGPEGTAWCSVCKQFKITEEFVKNSKRWNGVSSTCIFCSNISRNRWRKRKQAKGLPYT